MTEEQPTWEKIYKSFIDQELPPSKQLSILVQMADEDGRKYEIYRELRNGKNILMVRFIVND